MPAFPVEPKEKNHAMKVFGNYSRYYDLLYEDKDYKGEALYVRNLVRQYSPSARTILDLGCGTGSHDVFLGQDGYTITGVDMSESMLAKAQEKLTGSPALASSIRFLQGDVRTVRLKATFDAVISLFHVISYQTRNADILEMLETVRTHLRPGGLFLFDCWYGPAVASNPPSIRVKRMENDALAVTRIAEPVVYPEKNVVDVNYTVFIKDKQSGAVEEVRETHTVRYLFTPEIDMMLAGAGFSILASEEWITKKPLGLDTWGALFVCRLES